MGTPERLDSDIVEACGAIHLHTCFSDGSVDFDTLSQTASAVGLDYVMVTDHMTIGGREKGLGRIHGNVVVIIGYEHDDTEGKNHYLVFGTPGVVPERERPQLYVDAVRRAGGIGFIAHPAEKRRYFRLLPAYPWTDWSVTGFDGIEIWNQMSDWVENLRSWFSIVRFAYPRRFLSDISPELLRRWDGLNRTRFVAGLGGVDAHTRILRFGPFRYTVFPLKVELKGVRTHLYLDKPLEGSPYDEAEKSLLAALRDGRGFVSNYRRGDARGARFYYRSITSRKRQWPGKAAFPVALPGFLHASLPHPAEVRLVHDGAMVARMAGRVLTFPIREPGVYRLEAYRQRGAWIYSNPFRLLPSGAKDNTR